MRFFILPPLVIATLVVAQNQLSLPLSTSGSYLINAAGERVPYVGINWPGAAETMLPEGLQYSSIASIVDKIVQTGFNAVRLTFAIELVDDIVDGGGDVAIELALTRALGTENGTQVAKAIFEKNPNLLNGTRLTAFDAIATELANRNVYLHLDNHMSKAGWCCESTDGNAWFGDTYFNTTKWVRGLAYMATHGKSNWPSFVSIGLRNELRPAISDATGVEPLTWPVWSKNMEAAASAVYVANPSLLIFFSGQLFDFDISGPVNGFTSSTPSWSFNVSSLPYAKNFVFEMHQYDKNLTAGGCESYKKVLDQFGANATLVTRGNRAPLVMTEWGGATADADGAYNSPFRNCLLEFLVERKLGWMVWVLAGSYYIRQEVQDFDETFGILDHTWTGYRGDKSLELLKRNIADTYAAYNLSVPLPSNSTSTAASTPKGTETGTGTPTATVAKSAATMLLGSSLGFIWVMAIGLALYSN